MSDLFPTIRRLGDTIDDFCVKCKRPTNHSIVSLVDATPVKVRCQSCYSDHDFLHEQAPPRKPRKVVVPPAAQATAGASVAGASLALASLAVASDADDEMEPAIEADDTGDDLDEEVS